ncbi:hypothetical protein HDU91_004612 [Kappamyces sp. JEL0680]|nr:hypothetical protein HDU91_004612 [Kappamyces sp. JEL0680]
MDQYGFDDQDYQPQARNQDDIDLGVMSDMPNLSPVQEVGRAANAPVMPWHLPSSAMGSSVGGRRSAVTSSSPIRGAAKFDFASSEGGMPLESSVSGFEPAPSLDIPLFDQNSFDVLTGKEKDYEIRSFLGYLDSLMREIGTNTLYFLDVVRDESRATVAQAFYNVLMCAHAGKLAVQQVGQGDICLSRV